MKFCFVSTSLGNSQIEVHTDLLYEPFVWNLDVYVYRCTWEFGKYLAEKWHPTIYGFGTRGP